MVKQVCARSLGAVQVDIAAQTCSTDIDGYFRRTAGQHILTGFIFSDVDKTI
ncbi:hypothetical protein [Methylobacterium nigriterrae]|uniref:hypothetical protein n=1 Tax=Methylobacterium nigriterrae TaxID=3127512 RepID=UPI003013491E